jgi:hypothetical protein
MKTRKKTCFISFTIKCILVKANKIRSTYHQAFDQLLIIEVTIERSICIACRSDKQINSVNIYFLLVYLNSKSKNIKKLERFFK